jgi:hypothetical protein
MSSLVRRIQKNIAKSMGFHRGPVRHDKEGDPVLGLILDGKGEETKSTKWPQVKAPTKVKE